MPRWTTGSLLAISSFLFAVAEVSAQSLAYAPWVPLQSAPRRDYDIRMGELFFDLVGTLELEYNTNINTSEFNEISDLIITPGISAGGSWNYSDLNTLRFGVGLQYRYYLNNPELSNNGSIFDLTPETEVDTIILVGEAYIRIFDQISLSSDAADSVGIDPETGELTFDTVDYASFTNTLGAQVSYDFNIFQSSAQLYLRDVISFEETFDFVDRVEYGLSGTLSKRLLSTVTVGVGAGVDTVQYAASLKGDIDSFNFGFYSNAILTPFLSLYAGVNYGVSEIGSSGNGLVPGRQTDSLSYNITLSHTLNAYFDHSIGLSSVRRLGSIADYLEIRTLRYDWALEEAVFVDLTGFVAWEAGAEEGGSFAENYDRFSISVQADYPLGPRTKLTGRITHTQKWSDQALRSYEQDVYWLRFTYDF